MVCLLNIHTKEGVCENTIYREKKVRGITKVKFLEEQGASISPDPSLSHYISIPEGLAMLLQVQVK